MMPEGPKPVRLYKVWKGNNRFFCGGRLLFGPDAASVLLTIVLISSPSVTFIAQIITKILGNVNKQSHILGYPVLFVVILATTADLVFLLLTSGRDPGIVPRNTKSLDSKGLSNELNASMEWLKERTSSLGLPRTKDVTVNGVIVKVKYCDTCLLYRPPRASHCSICNNCVQKFDHHCPWVAQCIGLRNYRFFFLFISSSTFLCIYVFSFSWLNILGEMQYHENSLWKSMKSEIVSLVLIIYTFIVVWFVGGLTVFHLYLISTNQTTYENFRYRYDKKENPYNCGFLKNFKEVFLSKTPPSVNDFRSWILPGISETGSNLTSLKEEMDVELGMGKEKQSENMSIPSILQSLDYSSFENNNLKDKGRKAIGTSKPTSCHPLTKEPNVQTPPESIDEPSEVYKSIDEAAFEDNGLFYDSSPTSNKNAEMPSRRVSI